ncbi:MAG: hypothetical protein M1594_01355 [Candidatus Marsarchaeota archaeon]|nr:hypothetical protein [Candidatus Marsarchaeota archaeon]
MSLNEKIELAKNPKTNSETLRQLAKENNTKIKLMISKHRNADEDTLNELSKKDDYSIRAAVAENKNASEKILRKLSEDNKDTFVLWELTKNPSTPKDILEKFAKNKNFIGEMAREKLKNRK